MTETVKAPEATKTEQVFGIPNAASNDGAASPTGIPQPPAPRSPDAGKPEVTEEDKAKQKTKDGGEDQPEVVDEQPEAPELIKYEPTGDTNIDAIMEILNTSGVAPSAAGELFKEALEANDPSKVDWAALQEEVGVAKMHAIRALAQEFSQDITSSERENTALVGEVHNLFGGEEGWNTVAQWAQAREKRDPKFKAQLDDIRDDIANGSPRAVKAAARELLDLYNGNPKTKGLGNGKVQRGSGVPSIDARPMSKDEYLKAVTEAHAKRDMALVKQLQARRKAGMAAGI